MKKVVRAIDIAYDLAKNSEQTAESLAKKYNVSISWIALVMQSDGFNAALASAKGLGARPDNAKRIRERARAIALQAADKLLETPMTKSNAQSILESFGIAASTVGRK